MPTMRKPTKASGIASRAHRPRPTRVEPRSQVAGANWSLFQYDAMSHAVQVRSGTGTGLRSLFDLRDGRGGISSGQASGRVGVVAYQRLEASPLTARALSTFLRAFIAGREGDGWAQAGE